MNRIELTESGNMRMPYLRDEEIWEDLCAVMRFLATALSERKSILDEMGTEAKGALLALQMSVKSEVEHASQVIRKRAAGSAFGGVSIRITKLFSAFQLNDFEKLCIVLAVAASVDPILQEQLKKMENEWAKGCPTAGLVFLMEQFIKETSFSETAGYIGRSGDIRFCLENSGLQQAEWHDTPVRLSRSLSAWIMGGDFVPGGERISQPQKLPPLLLYESVLQSALSAVHKRPCSDSPLIFYFYGEKGSGKKLLLSHLGKQLGMKPLFFSCHAVMRMEKKEREAFWEELVLEQRLTGGFFCMCDLPADREERGEDTFLIRKFLERLAVPGTFLAVTGSGKRDLPILSGTSCLSFALARPSGRKKASVWQYYRDRFDGDGKIDVEFNGNRYVMTPGEVENVFRTASLLARANGRTCAGESDVQEAVHQLGRGTLGEYAEHIESAFVWDDLIVEETVKRRLRHICSQVRYRSTVGDEWGFFRKTPYGRGISALFYGPPGTGKTMAAQVMAAELGLDLYRVDLSRMVSKYVGETEKNISALFERASQMNVILFFDEADSLFTKRSEVKDANDRNANAETAHLLQKLESYEGIVILATNLAEQIDDAFKRRIRFMIPFRFPDADTRRILWKSLIPETAPVEDGTDLDFFAERFELSGSQIKEIIVNAAFIAVSEGRVLDNEAIKESLALNYAKYGKQLTREDFGYLN